MSEPRYKVGLKEGVSSFVTDRNPGYHAIVDIQSPFAFGVVVALVEEKEMAAKICALLNAAEFPSHV